jgi:hypothetical protein
MNTVYDSRVNDYNSDLRSTTKRDDDVLSLGAGVQYMMNSWFGLFSSYTFIRSNSTVASYDYSRNLIEAGIVFRY